MNIYEARRILGVTEQDDVRMVKIKFRKLMRAYHPDSIGSDTERQIQKAQEINEAYEVLVKKKTIPVNERTPKQKWKGEVNENAFVERNIYMPGTMDAWQKQEYHAVARGRYVWDPNQEEFELFLRSIYHAANEVLEGIERQNGIYHGYEQEIQGSRFTYLTKVFHCLATQYIQSISCLKKIAEPETTDQQGRSIYLFRAFLGAKGSCREFEAISRLQEGSVIYPASLTNNKIMATDVEGYELGYLSLEDDQLYYILIPILQHHKAQVKLVVNEIYINKKMRPYRAKVNIDLFLRMKDMDELQSGQQDLQLAEALTQYEAFLKDI